MYVKPAGVGTAILCSVVAFFQAALALGLSLGDATFGGAAPTGNGVLTPAFRVIAAFSSIVLVCFAAVFLVRSGVVHTRLLGDRFVFGATWIIVGFVTLNTIGDLLSPHPLERWGMGTITLVLAVLGAFIALRGLAPAGASLARD